MHCLCTIKCNVCSTDWIINYKSIGNMCKGLPSCTKMTDTWTQNIKECIWSKSSFRDSVMVIDCQYWLLNINLQLNEKQYLDHNSVDINPCSYEPHISLHAHFGTKWFKTVKQTNFVAERTKTSLKWLTVANPLLEISEIRERDLRDFGDRWSSGWWPNIY